MYFAKIVNGFQDYLVLQERPSLSTYQSLSVLNSFESNTFSHTSCSTENENVFDFFAREAGA